MMASAHWAEAGLAAPRRCPSFPGGDYRTPRARDEAGVAEMVTGLGARWGWLLMLMMVWACRAVADPGQVTIGPIRFDAGGRDALSIGRDVTVGAGANQHRVTVIAGDAVVEGEVHEGLSVFLGNVKLSPGAVVGGDVIVMGGTIERSPDAVVNGRCRSIVELEGAFGERWVGMTKEWLLGGVLLARPLPHGSGWAWALAGGFALLYLLVALLLPRPVEACVAALEARPMSSFVVGLLSFLLMGPLVLLLVISVVGMVALPFLGCALILAFLLGKVTVFEYTGARLVEQAGIRLSRYPVLALLAGAALFCLLYAIPVVGFLVWGLAATFGFGAVMIAIFRSFGREQPARVIVQPSAVGGAAAGLDAPPAVPPSGAMELARAGFWIRVAAVATDLILLGTLAFLLEVPKALPIVWLLYHFGMWSWKGSTIGGMIVGIKIVRSDGRVIDHAVALVRCLSAIFSAAVLFLGFFWTGWDREKRSWHDKIAGTVVVRLPRR